MRGYLYLSGSIILEVFATTMLKVSDGFSVLLPSLLLVIGYMGSFYCLSLCLNYLPLSLAYAIWTGLGTVLTAIIGITLWHDPFNTFTFIGFTLIISGVVLLNLSSEGH
ncbi:multidrug efflux SMR transporter [Vagococcus sp. PNs007]|uniref:Multidrug efflux SMR transporter n=1 Tax=Vagococcus proximus TaxID=2991417 RepID=A0ABT5WZU2_9ENTE|nr:multidrug efflux SMR transporter [Vagococcus proximus]MDF0479172.1 multidrug efflux SMR transporter [Vagococcus proximus]